jgi:uncharacterized protein YndB with AHSA1/START domain
VTVRRARVVSEPPEVVWAVVGDPRRLPRWWPRVERVEAVGPEGWTSVLRSERGKAVRADYRVEVDEPPSRRAWVQELEGSPFERLWAENRTEVALAPAGSGTEVTLTVRQRMRRTARLGTFMLRRATRRSLDDALAALAAELEPADTPGRS